MSERNGGPSRWPELPREPVELPPLSEDPTLRELALHYATVASGYHEFLPRIVDALEWLKARYDAGVLSTTPLALPAGISDPPPARGRMPSVEDLEDAARRGAEHALEGVQEQLEELEEVVTGSHHIPPPGIPSERVRAITRQEVREEIARLEGEKAKAELKRQEAEDKASRSDITARKWKAFFMILSTILGIVSAVLIWDLTRGHR